MSPSSGVSKGETDSIAIQYAVTNLATGTYTAALTVTDPNASNTPQAVSVTLHVMSPADFDLDGDADQSDFGHMQRCFSGQGSPIADGCQDADLNADGSVDDFDTIQFQPCMAGANRPPGC